MGVPELIAALKEVSGDQFQRNMKETYAAASMKAARLIGAETPIKTGRLAMSIRSKPTTKGGNVSLGSKAVPYAGPDIFGSPKQGIKGNPFPFRVIASHREDLLKEYEDGVNAILKKVGLL